MKNQLLQKLINICFAWVGLFGLMHTAMAQSVNASQQPIKVVATFSILADMVQQVGGDAVEVVSLVGYGADAHVFAPTPADVRVLSQAQWVVTNGLGFEGWINRLISSSGYKGPLLVASKGVVPLIEHDSAGAHGDHNKKSPHHHHGDQDPHAWQDLRHAKIYVENIRAGLVKLLPGSRDSINQRAQDYTARIDALNQNTQRLISSIPESNRRVMTTHDAFGYFAAAYNIEFLSVQGWSTDREPSAAQVGQLIKQIRQDKIKALFIEHLADSRLINRIAEESGAKLGGTLYVDALTPPGTVADTYLKMFSANVDTIYQALQ